MPLLLATLKHSRPRRVAHCAKRSLSFAQNTREQMGRFALSSQRAKFFGESQKARLLRAILLIAAQAIAVFLLVWQPNFEYPLNPAVIKHDAGHSYIAEIGGLKPHGYEYADEDVNSSASSGHL